MTLVHIGRLGRAHGVGGEIHLDSLSLSVEEITAVAEFVARGSGGTTRPLRLASIRSAGSGMLARFEGIQTREQAAALAGSSLLAEARRLPDAGPGMVYTFQLVGLQVVNTDGRELGRIEEVLRTGAHPVYVVRGAREILIPAAGPVVRDVDLERGVMTVELPPGLEDL